MSLINNNKNLFKSLEQGLGIISERTNNIFSLKDKIKHSKDNIIEGFCETGTVDEKITCFKEKHQEKGTLYQTTMEDYSGNYRTFLVNLKKRQTDVSNCKLKCYEEDAWKISSSDYGDGDPNQETPAKFKTIAKRACKVGCHLNLPQIMECNDVFKGAASTQTFNDGATTINEGDTCNQIYEKIDVNNKVNTFQDGTGSNVRNKLQQILDEDGNNALYHCCKGKLSKKFKPYKIMNNRKYTSCADFEDSNTDPATIAGFEAAAKQTACLKGKNNKFESTIGDYNFQDKYQEVKTLNNNMMKTSEEILDIVKELKDLGETIVQSSKEETMKFRNDNESYEEILKNIKKESDPMKVNTIDQYIRDKTMLKKSTDLKLYVWIVLALGFGISALMKIKNL